jgi:hypothetical protein
MKKIIILLIIPIVAAALVLQVPSVPLTNAQILEKDPPALQTLDINGTVTDLGQRDVSIDIEDEPMPANGTISISTEGADDIDVQSMPPAGFTIIIDNTTARVTTHPVTIEARESLEADTAEQAEEESSDDEQDNDEDSEEEG